MASVREDCARNACFAPACVLSVQSLLSLIANGLVFIAFIKYECLRNPSLVLHINLTIDHLLCTFILYPMCLISTYKRMWLFGWIGCQFYGFVGFLYGITNLSLISALSLDRYAIICGQHRQWFMIDNRHKAIAISAFCWGYGAFWSILPLLGWSSYYYEPFGTGCTINYFSKATEDISYNITAICISVGTNIPIMIFAYSSIIRRLRSRNIPVTLDEISQRRRRHEKTILLIVFAMISSSLFCWLPYCIVSVRAEFLPFHEISISVSAIAVCLAKSSSLINPLLYVILNPRIRRAVVLIVQWRRGEPNRLNQSHWKNDESQTIPMTVRRPLEPRPALVE